MELREKRSLTPLTLLQNVRACVNAYIYIYTTRGHFGVQMYHVFFTGAGQALEKAKMDV